jgi:hypothetical protein
MRDYSAFLSEDQKGAAADSFGVYPASINTAAGGTVFMANEGDRDVLVSTLGKEAFSGEDRGGYILAPLNHENAAALRRFFPFTKPAPVLGRPQSFGLGDRLGIAGEGHLRVFAQCGVAPVLAQQSIRELTLTGRSFAEVIDAATFAVFRSGYKKGFGADGDHLKTFEHIQSALEAGCTMITLDCSDHIQAAGKTEQEIYGGAVEFCIRVWQEFFAGGSGAAQLELSIDETDVPTTPAQHRYVAEALIKAGVGFVSLAPRFHGEFQKGVDYRGDVAQFERELISHVDIANTYGYKLSIHSGSDKFAVLPVLARHCERFHIKTAGTSWLEAMRICAQKDPALYRQCHAYALETFEQARKFYHVSTNMANIPALAALSDGELPLLFDNDDLRQLIHITYGFILQKPALHAALYALWRREREAYAQALYRHIGRHVTQITGKPLSV